jgi:hypothetical protein
VVTNPVLRIYFGGKDYSDTLFQKVTQTETNNLNTNGTKTS